MASRMGFALRLAVSCSQCSSNFVTRNLASVTVTQVRWNRYAKIYIDPTVDKEELSTPLDEMDERRFRPIKAAQSQHTTSLFYDPLVHKFINMMMKGGNKRLVKDIMDRTLENVKRIQLEKYHKASDEEKATIECNPSTIFHQAIENCKPILILIKIPKGGVMYRVPVPCNENYQRFKAIKWIVESCRDKERKIPMEIKLSWEIVDAYCNQGKSVKKKQDLHKQCEANKAYAHFRW